MTTGMEGSAQQPASDDFENIDHMQSAGPRKAPAAEALRTFAEAEHHRDGQFTANLRDRFGRTRRSTVLKWFDAPEPDGRYGLTQAQRPGVGLEIILAGLGAPELTSALDNRVHEVRTLARS